MKKEIIKRSLMGIPIGITICYIITIIFSLIYGRGHYLPANPEFIAAMGGEMKATIVQVIFSGFIGLAMGASSIIWDIKDWSIAKQTGIYFGLIALVNLPIAYYLGWMERSFSGLISYSLIFIIIFIVIWISQYLFWKGKIKKMNQKIKNINK